jgi:hypothetical protein
MKFYQPQIQLARETVLDSPDAFYLHIVTFCPRTAFRENGFETPGFGPNNETMAQGLYKVIIKIYEDTSLPDFDYITPIVHTIDLGNIAFPGGEGFIEVQLQGAVFPTSGTGARSGTNPTSTTKTGGAGTVSTTSADNKSRPIDDARL